MVSSLSGLYDKHRTSNWFWFCSILLFCCAILLPVPLLGIPDGYDVPQHVRFMAVYHEALRDDSILPAWAAVDNLGYGSVGIRVYPPLVHFLMSLTQVFTGDWYDTIWINTFFWFFLGSFGVYLWAKEHLSSEAAFVAALLYSVMPYHLMQFYQYMLIAEFAASGVLPFCFLYGSRIIDRKSLTDVLLFSLACSVLILTHLPTLIVATLGLSIYFIFRINWKDWLYTVTRFAAAGLLTLLATSFYWTKLVSEMSWVQHSDPHYYATSIYDYKQYLFPMILNTDERFWKKMIILLDIPTLMTFLFLLPIIVCLLVKIRAEEFKVPRKLIFALSAVGAFLIFIMSMPSVYLWDSVLLLQRVQFPFRFLSLASLIGSVSFIVAITLLIHRFPHFKRQMIYPSLGLVLAAVLFNLTQVVIPAAPLPREEFAALIEKTKTEPGCRCWWPSWADPAAFSKSEQATAGSRTVEVLEWGRERRAFAVGEGQPGDVRVATFWYPHWKATVNGVAVEVGRDENGAILIPVGAERSEVRLYFEEPFFLDAAKYVSLATWIILLLAILAVLIRKKESTIKLASVA